MNKDCVPDNINSKFQNLYNGYLITIHNFPVGLISQLIVYEDDEDIKILNENKVLRHFERIRLTNKTFVFNDGKCKILLMPNYCEQFIIDDNQIITVKVDNIKFPNQSKTDF